MFVPSDWFSAVREASHRSPFDVVAMQKEDFKNYKDFICSRYSNRHFSSGGSVFRDVHWLTFGWGEEVDPVSGKVTLVHHLNEVWMRCTYSDSEPWKKVKILKESPGSVLLEQLYHAPLVLKPAKVQDLKKMARDHIPHPQRYLQMSGDGDGGRETKKEDDNWR